MTNPHQRLSTSRLANAAARTIFDGFVRFHDQFHTITRRAAVRFPRQDWRGMQDDARLRLQVRSAAIDELLETIKQLLADRLQSRITWIGIKAVYSGLIDDRDDWEIAETFFNSVTRRVFTTVGVDPEIEFVHTDYASPPTPSRHDIYRSYEIRSISDTLVRILQDHVELETAPETVDASLAIVASQMAEHRQSLGLPPSPARIEVIQTVFYRGEHAYLVGRAVTETPEPNLTPLVLCFHHNGQDVQLDAVLLDESDISLLFSYTRSYFHVGVQRPYDLVQFIKTILPRKSRAEIYISLGYYKHGKTVLYRHALRHLARSADTYRRAEGQRGMVMTVFTMPSYPVVIKIIKDQFDYPKSCLRQDVMDRYHLVFEHDRAGRLIDAQEYEYLVLDRRRFEDDLIDELLEIARQSVIVQGDQVVIKHCYAERRVIPLNVYLKQVDTVAAGSAVIDYGNAIKDLAFSNLFPGDLMLKNFGVTRHNRVVFDHYDEVCLLTDCNFRKFPEARSYDEEMAAEPWFAVSPEDVFPEEFSQFLGLPPHLKEVFVEHHGDLLSVEFWRKTQCRLEAGELFTIRRIRLGNGCALAPDRTLPERRVARHMD